MMMIRSLKKNIVFIIPFIIIIISSLIYLSFILFFTEFGQSNNRLINILENYDEIQPGSVIFLGDSQVREDIDCNVIDSENLSCFNYGIAGILPNQMVLQKDLIISSQPKMVIIGISPLLFNEDINKNDDFIFFSNGIKIPLDGSILRILNEDELDILSMNKFESLIYQRKFIAPYFIKIYKKIIKHDNNRKIENNFKDPYFFIEDQTVDELMLKISDFRTIGLFDINNSSIRQWEALQYFIKGLTEEDIQVKIILMPLNPLLIEKINQESLERYHDYLDKISNKYNLVLINMEKEYNISKFSDLTHLNIEGRRRFSLDLSRGDYNIIQ